MRETIVTGGQMVDWTEKGQEREGYYKDLVDGKEYRGKISQLLVLESESGESFKVPLSVVLEDKIVKVKRGTYVWIKFLGEVEGKTFNYKNFQVDQDKEKVRNFA